MPDRPPSPTSSEPTHAFKPSNGLAMGFLGIAAAVFVIVLAAVTERNIVGLRVGLLAAVVGVLSWMVLLRPRVRVYSDTLLLRNMASDTVLPLARVQTVLVRHTLNVWVDERRYSCAGIGRTSRSMMRASRGGGSGPGAGLDYVSFVETTIDDLARAARRDHQPEPAVQRRWAWLELGMVAVFGLAFVVALFV